MSKKFLKIFAILIMVFTIISATVLSAGAVSGTKPGDVNDDGSVSVIDVFVIRRFVASYPETLNLNAADLYKDGKVTAADVMLLRMLIAELITEEDLESGQIPTLPVKTTRTTANPTTTTRAFTTKPATTTKSNTSDSFINQVVALVNEQRAANGLSKLTVSDRLTRAAATRAKEVAVKFDHTRPDGSPFYSVLSEVGYSYRNAGENIAWGYTSPSAVMDGWMNSSGHRANILNANFTEIGVGYDAASRSWVQLFGLPM